MRLIRWCLPVIVVLSTLTTGCRKPDGNLGLGLQPDGEILDLFSDTLAFSLDMVPVDSLRSDERSRLLLGNLIDPISGRTSAFFSTELRLSQTSIDFGTNAVCDSVEFVLRFNGPAYGFNQPQYLVVEQLADTLSIDSVYYTIDRPETVPGNLVVPSAQPVQMHPLESVYVGDDTLSPQVRILLDPLFGQGLMDADTAVFASNDAWRAHFRGLQVRSESIGGIVSLEPNSGVSFLRLHYHNDEDTTTYSFVVNSNAARVSQFEHSWPSEFAPLNDSLATSETERVVLSGCAGSYLRLDLTGLDSLDAPDGAVINRAEVVLPVNGELSKFPQPGTLTTFLKSETGGLELAPEAAAAGVTYGGTYDETRNAYILNLPVYAQRRLNGVESRPYVYLYSELSSVALEQVAFDTPVATANASFVVTWSQ